MNFDITPSSTTPIFRQILDQVKRLIASGQLRAGDALPSVRAVASFHAINPMTVSKAYSMLETEGVLARLRGVGMVVAERRTSRKDKLSLLKPSLMAAAQIAHQLQLDDDEALALFQSCLDELRKNDDE